ncbi:hypothetical protein [Arthrobacter sp. CJ23]|uniref:hypothetical protein n=1 Tax=Arthrobacter sp. CJ23 TaxID=2972479 RepID=UPI00215BC1ED|nr:hypothetical protein [Arthrobacter sp. CJ23]UVJ40246.1 hypothetical protein NVV90_03400 [Arthrobacter sp. CJ23]
MTRHNLFTAWRENYAKNYNDGESLRVIPAQINHQTGNTPGVAIFVGSRVTLVLTAEHAYSLANGIADTLETHPNRVTTKQEN